MTVIEILDPQELLTENGWSLINEMKEFSLLMDKRIGWNYPLDYLFVAHEFAAAILGKRQLKIVDVGCGPGAVHGYLESRHGCDIIGVDLNRWESDYVDFQGDFTSPEFRRKNNLEDLDVIISTSAFEHNRPSSHRFLVSACRAALADTGVLICTSAITNGQRKRFKYSSQWNLTETQCEKIYGSKPSNSDAYDHIYRRWQQEPNLVQAFSQRFPGLSEFDPGFMSLGVSVNRRTLPKPGLLNQLSERLRGSLK